MRVPSSSPKPFVVPKPNSVQRGQTPTVAPGLVGGTTGGKPSVTGGTGSVLPPGGQGKPQFQGGPVGEGFQPGSFETPTPGVSGITPGAVERRLAGRPGIPPTAQMRGFSGINRSPSAQLQLGNTLGVRPGAVSDPVAILEQLLRTLG